MLASRWPGSGSPVSSSLPFRLGTAVLSRYAPRELCGVGFGGPSASACGWQTAWGAERCSRETALIGRCSVCLKRRTESQVEITKLLMVIGKFPSCPFVFQCFGWPHSSVGSCAWQEPGLQSGVTSAPTTPWVLGVVVCLRGLSLELCTLNCCM